MIFKVVVFVGALIFAVLVVHCPEIMIYTASRINRFIKKSLRKNESFMRWLYGDDYSSKNLEVKVYNDGWRKGDYK